jgi:hypothetical protein
MRARSGIVERDEKNNIVFVKDLSPYDGGMTITNDAEAVVDYYRSVYGNRVRIVYLDTNEEWWEILWTLERHRGTTVDFKPWHGLVWDKLSKVES